MRIDVVHRERQIHHPTLAARREQPDEEEQVFARLVLERETAQPQKARTRYRQRADLGKTIGHQRLEVGLRQRHLACAAMARQQHAAGRAAIDGHLQQLAVGVAKFLVGQQEIEVGLARFVEWYKQHYQVN